MFGEFMFGVPVHTLHDLRRETRLKSNEEEMPDEEQVSD